MIFAHGQGVCMLVDIGESTSGNLPKKAKAVFPSLYDDASSSLISKNNDNAGKDGEGALITGSKRKRTAGKLKEKGNNLAAGSNYATITSYRSIIHVGYFDQHLVIIENPWVNVLQRLPATLARKRYGT